MARITRQNIETTYRTYAPFYDLMFGRALQSGRLAMCEHVRSLAPQRLLEIGVGTGLTLQHYPAATAVVGIDVSQDMLDVARQRVASLPGRSIELALADGEQLDFPDASFDCVTLPYVLSVTPSPAQLCAEMRRVCKPGGDILVLNHFSGSKLWKLPEKFISPLADRIGFRSSFPYAEHIEHPDWTILARRPANLLQISLLVHIRNAPARTAANGASAGA